MSYDHDEIADKLAKKLKTKHRHEGVDIVAGGKAIEVAVTKNDLYQSVGQLKRSRAEKKYVAVPAPLIPNAKKLLEDTGIGVMNTRMHALWSKLFVENKQCLEVELDTNIS